MKPLNLFFLDIDGVLNSYVSWMTLGSSYKDHTNFDPIAVRLLFLACQQCDLKLLIHSSWSASCNTEYYKEAFKEYETEKIKMPEILDYINRGIYFYDNRPGRIVCNYHEYKPDKWVVVDDEELEGQLSYYKVPIEGGLVIRTDRAVGFTYYDYLKILKFFDKNVPLIEVYGE
jgi:hypothetical protein